MEVLQNVRFGTDSGLGRGTVKTIATAEAVPLWPTCSHNHSRVQHLLSNGCNKHMQSERSPGVFFAKVLEFDVNSFVNSLAQEDSLAAHTGDL